jgi:hypothetical protein
LGEGLFSNYLGLRLAHRPTPRSKAPKEDAMEDVSLAMETGTDTKHPKIELVCP